MSIKQPKKIGYIAANFGGPRDLTEVEPFLRELLTDKDVVRTGMPSPLHNYIFRRVAKKRAIEIQGDYKSIGGCSPIYADTEALAQLLRPRLNGPLITFHRYLPATHQAFIEAVQKLDCDEIRVFPLFPQFTYATTGSIARWFKEQLPYTQVNKMRWIKSYAGHPSFIQSHQANIREFLTKAGIPDEDTVLFFSAHGVPQKFVRTGDIYLSECTTSFELIMEAFPKTLGRLCFQSKFGPGEWLRPYTIDACTEIRTWHEGRKQIVFIPISFTSDHIETLHEVESQYMTVITKEGLQPHRVPALTLRNDWIEAILAIINENNLCNNQMLIRPTV